MFYALLYCIKSVFSKCILDSTRCLKITEKVTFNIASEASYVYILSGQKLIKNAKKWSILACFLKTRIQCYNGATRQVTLSKTKIGEKYQVWKIQMRHFEYFSNIVNVPGHENKLMESDIVAMYFQSWVTAFKSPQVIVFQT